MLLHTHLDASGPKNVTVRVRGRAAKFEVVEFFDREKLKQGPSALSFRDVQMASALWTINEKMGLFVWLDAVRRDPEDLVLIMESRNSLRFEREVNFPANWNGKLYLEPFNLQIASNGWFMFLLEFDKVGR